MRKIGFFVFVIFVVFESCTKDDSGGSPLILPHGYYKFGGRSNIIIKKWIAGGVEVPVMDSDYTNIKKEGIQMFEGIKLHFGANSKLSLIDSIYNVSDTFDYKIINTTVYIFVGPNSYTNSNYVPYFTIDGSNLYSNFQEVWYYDYFGENGLGMLKLNNINLVDTALKEMGYTSLNQLKNQDKIIYSTFRDNFKHED